MPSQGAPPGFEKLLTPGEVATLFRVDPKTVTRWAQSGKLTSVRTLGRHRRYREDEVRALLSAADDPLAVPAGTLWPPAVSGMERTVRTRLHREGVDTVGDLTSLTAGELRSLGFRPPQVDVIRLALYKRGLALAGEFAATG